ncbi:MAG TPA: hypothetical protein VEB21_03675 [Terriglobales bacterium]|nr:hypothetical protein [Terriglobales bacterium]
MALHTDRGSTPKPAGKLYIVDFDRCVGAGAPTADDDFACTVEGCSDGFGAITDCGCEITARP